MLEFSKMEKALGLGMYVFKIKVWPGVSRLLPSSGGDTGMPLDLQDYLIGYCSLTEELVRNPKRLAPWEGGARSVGRPNGFAEARPAPLMKRVGPAANRATVTLGRRPHSHPSARKRAHAALARTLAGMCSGVNCAMHRGWDLEIRVVRRAKPA